MPDYAQEERSTYADGFIHVETLEKAFTKALRDFFPTLKRNADPRAEFYAVYQRESQDYDRYFIKKYDDDLNTTLIFAGLFSAVASAFIIDAQNTLQEDYAQTSAALLRILVQNIATPGTNITLPEWTGPSKVNVDVQCMLYSSLSAALLAAFVAMLGKQWLNRYARVEKRGSLIERCRDRQAKADGITRWGFHFVMESLPLLLQFALLLLGYAIGSYLWSFNHAVGTVIIAVTSFGLLLYAFIVIAATWSYNCPFHTPVSFALRYAISYEHKRQLIKLAISYLFTAIYPLLNFVNRVFIVTHGRIVTQGDVEPSLTASLELEWLAAREQSNRAEPIFKSEPVNADHAEDVRCVSWLLRKSTDADVTLSAVRFIPGVEHHSKRKATPSLARLYDALSACFDSTDDFLTPEMRDKACAAAKMFIQIYTQRRCIDGREAVIKELSLKAGAFPQCQQEDPELHSTLEMVREIVQDNDDNWPCFKIMTGYHGMSPSHWSWIAHILLYRMWEFSRTSNEFPDGVYDFLRGSMSLPFEHPFGFPVTLLADCLLMIGLIVGLPLVREDLWAVDKSKELNTIIDHLYKQLNWAFRTPLSDQAIRRLLAALRIMNSERIAPHLATWSTKHLTSQEAIPEGTTHPQEELFQTIMRSTINHVDKWNAARLALQLALRNPSFHPYFKDSYYIILFLHHHLELEEQGEQHPESIANAFEALSSPFLTLMPEFRATPLLLEGMRKALKADRLLRLRRTALFFIDWVGYQGFDAVTTVLSPQARYEFCSDLADVGIDLSWNPRLETCYTEILLRMVNSETWRPYIRFDQWERLEVLCTSYIDSDSLVDCLCNEELIPSLIQMRGGETIVKSWLKVAWKQAFETLRADLVDQIRNATLQLFLREGAAVMDEFEALINPHHSMLGVHDATRLESIRQKELIFKKLCEDFDRRMSEDDIVDSPIDLSSPTGIGR